MNVTIIIINILQHTLTLIMISCDALYRARARLTKQKEEEAKPPSEKAARLQELHKHLRVSLLKVYITQCQCYIVLIR